MAVKAKNHGGMVGIEIDLVLGPAGRVVPVNIEIGPHGLTIRRKGGRRSLWGGWDGIVARLSPDDAAAAKFLANPAGLLMEES